jgi:DNA-binding CsgD family transcriptional regulator
MQHLVDGLSAWRCGVERLSEREKEEIARLWAMGLPSRLIGQQIGRHHRTVWGHLQKLRQPAAVEPVRSPLRLSLHERGGRGFDDPCARLAYSPRHPVATRAHPMSRDTTSAKWNYRPCMICNSPAG